MRRGRPENLPVPLGRNYQQMYRMLPGFAPPANSHSIPTNPARSLEFTVNGTSDDQNNTRIDGVSTAHVQLPHVVSYIPDARVHRRSEHRHQQHGRGAGAGRRRRDQRADAQRHQRPPRVGLRVLHQPAPESLADAVRRCGPEHGRQAGGELPPVRRDRRRADQQEQDLLLRQLRVALATTVPSTTR